MRVAILAALEHKQPQTRAELAFALGAQDDPTDRVLVALRREHVVRQVGSMGRSRWALADFDVAMPRPPLPMRRRCVTPTVTSWWIHCRTREAFVAAARARALEMGWDR